MENETYENPRQSWETRAWRTAKCQTPSETSLLHLAAARNQKKTLHITVEAPYNLLHIKTRVSSSNWRLYPELKIYPVPTCQVICEKKKRTQPPERHVRLCIRTTWFLEQMGHEQSPKELAAPNAPCNRKELSSEVQKPFSYKVIGNGINSATIRNLAFNT